MRPIWRQTLVTGASAQILEGVVARLSEPFGHPASSFSGSSTAILGSSNAEAMPAIHGTSATWVFDLELGQGDTWLRGYLLTACRRYFGGCHTKTKDQKVEILLNDAPFERFRLAHIPPPRDDYFYRPAVPNIPLSSDLADCQTLYAWPVPRERIGAQLRQRVQITAERMVRWDIDYVGMVYQVEREPDYDIALSFAGEDRAYVDQIAKLLRENKIRVFYDLDARAELWGENLFDHLMEVYQERARYTVAFISKHYKQKIWTNHERRAAQARELTEQGYILPVRFDDTEIPGMLPTTGYIEASQFTPIQLVEIILLKLAIPEKA